MKKYLWLPGLIIIAIMYFFPTEWGKQRNVSRGGRWWAHREAIAPIISILIYLLIGILILISLTTHKTEKKEFTDNSIENISSQSLNRQSEEKLELKPTVANVDSPEVVSLPQPMVNVDLPALNGSNSSEDDINIKSSFPEVHSVIKTQEMSESTINDPASPSKDKPINSIENGHYIPGH